MLSGPGASSIVVRVSEISNLNGGMLRAIVTAKGVKTPIATVAHVSSTLPQIVESNFQVAKSSTGNRIEIRGLSFSATSGDRSDCANEVQVAFDPELPRPTIITCNSSLVVVDVANTSSLDIEPAWIVIAEEPVGTTMGGNM